MREKGIYFITVDNPNNDRFGEFYCCSLREVKENLIKFKEYYMCRMVSVYKIKKRKYKRIFSSHWDRICVDTKALLGQYINDFWGEGYPWDERVQ